MLQRLYLMKLELKELLIFDMNELLKKYKTEKMHTDHIMEDKITINNLSKIL